MVAQETQPRLSNRHSSINIAMVKYNGNQLQEVPTKGCAT